MLQARQSVTPTLYLHLYMHAAATPVPPANSLNLGMPKHKGTEESPLAACCDVVSADAAFMLDNSGMTCTDIRIHSTHRQTADIQTGTLRLQLSSESLISHSTWQPSLSEAASTFSTKLCLKRDFWLTNEVIAELSLHLERSVACLQEIQQQLQELHQTTEDSSELQEEVQRLQQRNQDLDRYACLPAGSLLHIWQTCKQLKVLWLCFEALKYTLYPLIWGVESLWLRQSSRLGLHCSSSHLQHQQMRAA